PRDSRRGGGDHPQDAGEEPGRPLPVHVRAVRGVARMHGAAGHQRRIALAERRSTFFTAAGACGAPHRSGGNTASRRHAAAHPDGARFGTGSRRDAAANRNAPDPSTAAAAREYGASRRRRRRRCDCNRRLLVRVVPGVQRPRAEAAAAGTRGTGSGTGRRRRAGIAAFAPPLVAAGQRRAAGDSAVERRARGRSAAHARLGTSRSTAAQPPDSVAGAGTRLWQDRTAGHGSRGGAGEASRVLPVRRSAGNLRRAADGDGRRAGESPVHQRAQRRAGGHRNQRSHRRSGRTRRTAIRHDIRGADVLDRAQRRGDADQRGGVDAAAHDGELRPELRRRARGREGAGGRRRDRGQVAGVREQAAIGLVAPTATSPSPSTSTPLAYCFLIVSFAFAAPVKLITANLPWTSTTAPLPVCFSSAPSFAPVSGSMSASPTLKTLNLSPTLMPASDPRLIQARVPSTLMIFPSTPPAGAAAASTRSR